MSERSATILSIVGKSGSGKTTLIERLVPALKGRGLAVGVLKHHHHLSSFDTPGKDTHRIAEAGADLVVGVSPVQVAVFRQTDAGADLANVIERYFAGMDVVLTEGYKRGDYPKIEVHRSARSPGLICDADELAALVSDHPWDLGVPLFDLDDVPAITEFIVAATHRD